MIPHVAGAAHLPEEAVDRVVGRHSERVVAPWVADVFLREVGRVGDDRFAGHLPSIHTFKVSIYVSNVRAAC